ncbi:MAG: B12-binding domain-containing radical SAM protein [bacterium]
MKILLVYPEYPDTFWGFKHSLKFISKKALLPPLGLLTIASMIPDKYERKLVDLNVAKLNDNDIIAADYVFISAMITQKDSVKEIIDKCKKLNKKIVAGGPLFTSLYDQFSEIDHFILDEGEITLPLFLNDLEKNNLKRIYTSDKKPDMSLSPIPQWDLLDFKYYSKMPIQYSRGCPFDCEFCDIVNLNGRIPRTKKPLQVIKELNSLVRKGWDGPIFIVDDNFIGNKSKSKELLRYIIKWRRLTKRSMTFMTEVSLNLSDDDELLALMRDAGFNAVFVGLETPSTESLQECGKYQNKNRSLVDSVKKIHQHGMEVSAGFIVGFDHDDETIFDRQIEFIQKTGVVIAMVGLLQALPGTKLYKRLKKENRLIQDTSGNNTDTYLNFIPKMNEEKLLKGYKKIISVIYSPKEYYERVLTFFSDYKCYSSEKLTWSNIKALFKSVFLLGIVEKDRKYYWKLFFISLFKYPESFSRAIKMAVFYAHFKRIFLN